MRTNKKNIESYPAYDVLIPAYNARATIGTLIEKLGTLSYPPEKICIVDDGSTDGMLSEHISKTVKIIRRAKNGGKGLALKEGFNWFLMHSDNPFLCCMDADLQHDPDEIKNFLQQLTQDSSTKTVIGARNFKWSQMPAHRIVSNRLTSWIVGLVAGFPVQDSQCGFRFIHRDILKNIHLNEHGFQLESEFFFRLAELNLRPEFVNISTIYTEHGSHIGHFRDTARFIKLIFREIRRKWFIQEK